MSKILFLTNSKLFPLDNGASLYSYSLIEYLKKQGNSIDLINFYSTYEYSENEIDKLKDICEEVNEVKLTNSSYVQNIDLFLPITIKKYYKKSMISFLKLYSNNYDYVVYDHLHMAIYRKYAKSKTHVLLEHNIETNIWLSYLKRKKGLFKVVIYWQYLLMKAYEKRVLKSFSSIITISKDEQSYAILHNSSSNVYIFKPNLIVENIKSIDNLSKTHNRLIFIGSYKWFPNQQAANYLVTELMPKLRKRNIGIELLLVGSNPTSEILKYGKDFSDIIVTGRVESIDPYILKSDIFINPIESGAGVNIKVIEALAKGIPVISTTFGCRGLDLDYGKDVLIYHTIDELVDHIYNLISNKELRLKLHQNGLNFYCKYLETNSEINKLFSS